MSGTAFLEPFLMSYIEGISALTTGTYPGLITLAMRYRMLEEIKRNSTPKNRESLFCQALCKSDKERKRKMLRNQLFSLPDPGVSSKT